MLDARERLKFDLWADVIMPGHVHLLVYPGDSGASAGQIRGTIKELAARFPFFDLATWYPQISQRDTDEETRSPLRKSASSVDQPADLEKGCVDKRVRTSHRSRSPPGRPSRTPRVFEERRFAD